MIIVLNGTSSSGKTTILRAIQNRASRIFLEFGIDKFIFMLPKRYLNTALWNDVLGLADRAGDTGNRLVAGMHRSAVCLHASGMDILMDHVLVEKTWKSDLMRYRESEEIYLVKVHCPLHILEAREAERKDRTLGQARKQVGLVHGDITYDLELDTSLLDPEACADLVIDRFGLARA